jgi:type I restriction enzyme S subunit
MDVKHGFAFPGASIRDEPPGDVLLTPGNFAVGGGFKGDKFKYFDGEVPEEYVLRENDLIVTMTDLSKQADTLGYPALVPKPQRVRYLHNQRLGKIVIRDPARVDKRFVSYLLRTSDYRHEILASATGTTVKHTSPSRILSFKALIPPPSEQRTIAHILGTLDDKIELNRRMNETLEAMARALFKSWFVDFEPVRAKSDGREPGWPRAVADLFPSSFEESELGDIPSGWRVGRVSDLCGSIYSGGTPSTRNPGYWNGSIPWLSSGETRDKFITDTERRITQEGVSNSSARLAPAFSTVIASAGQGNTRGQTSLLAIESYINQSVVVLTAARGTSSPLHLFFDMERRYEEFRRVSDAHSSRGSLTTKLIAGLPAVLPPIAIIQRFDGVAQAAVVRAIESLRESKTLTDLRGTLLPKLISGEVRVGRGPVATSFS